MTKQELKQLSELLDKAAEQFGNYAVNTSSEERRELYWAKADNMDRARRSLQLIRASDDYR